MNSRSSLALLTLRVGVPVAVATSCASASPGPQRGNIAAEAAALDAPNGQLDLTSTEAPAFGDPEVEALPRMEDAFVTRIAPDSSVAPPGETPYRVVFVWGHLPLAHDATAADNAPVPAQWTGSIKIDGGELAVLRTIAIDSSDELDTSVRGTLSFRSRTGAYVAGVLVRILVPPGVAPRVHVVTNLVGSDVDLSTLRERAGGIARAPDGDSGLGWLGFAEDLCARGFVLGRWIKDAPALGRSLAMITDPDGALLGYAKGIWGYTPSRAGGVWFDKYIDPEGRPKGLLFGWYGDGFYRGVWGANGEHDVNALEVGDAEGLYSDGLEVGDGRSVWIGRWSGPCVP